MTVEVKSKAGPATTSAAKDLKTAVASSVDEPSLRGGPVSSSMAKGRKTAAACSDDEVALVRKPRGSQIHNGGEVKSTGNGRLHKAAVTQNLEASCAEVDLDPEMDEEEEEGVEVMQAEDREAAQEAVQEDEYGEEIVQDEAKTTGDGRLHKAAVTQNLEASFDRETDEEEGVEVTQEEDLEAVQEDEYGEENARAPRSLEGALEALLDADALTGTNTQASRVEAPQHTRPSSDGRSETMLRAPEMPSDITRPEARKLKRQSHPVWIPRKPRLRVRIDKCQ